MKVSRRKVLQGAGSFALAGAIGCDYLPGGPWRLELSKAEFVAPQGESIDLVSHLLNRLS